jgi:thiamine-monophosphate kinase
MDQQYTPLTSLGEFGLIDRMTARLAESASDSRIICGIGDDAAVYSAGEGAFQVITTDSLLEGVHFDRTFVPMAYLGSKAITVNVSDIVAMNARPRVATISLGLPQNMSVEMVESLYDGIESACAAYGVQLVGGDTTSAHALYISIAMTGEVAPELVVFRRGARIGDAICVTGDLGGAYAGLKILLDQRRELQELGEAYNPDLSAYRYVIDRQLSPKARTDFIDALADRSLKPSSMIDISDGLASEINHICRQSDVGATIHLAALPFDPETRSVADQLLDEVDSYAFFGGEDYELLFTIAEKEAAKLEQDGLCAVIGTIEESSSGVNAFSSDTGLIPLHSEGYDHFDADGHSDVDRSSDAYGPAGPEGLTSGP